jgi:hypothetical protein
VKDLKTLLIYCFLIVKICPNKKMLNINKSVMIKIEAGFFLCRFEKSGQCLFTIMQAKPCQEIEIHEKN